MFHNIPEAMMARMRALEEIDARDRQDGTPRLQRLRQIRPQTGKFLALLAAGSILSGDVVALAFPFGRDTVAVRPADTRWLQTLSIADLERTIEIAGSEREPSFWVVARTGSRATLPVEEEAARVSAGEGSLGLVVVERYEVDHLRGDHLLVMRVQRGGADPVNP